MMGCSAYILVHLTRLEEEVGWRSAYYIGTNIWFLGMQYNLKCAEYNLKLAAECLSVDSLMPQLAASKSNSP